MEMNEQTFAAYVDGELSPEDAAKVVLHLADHPRDRARVDALMELNEALGQAYDQPMNEPAPRRILAAIEGRRVLAFPGLRRPAPRAALWAASGALAAGFAAFLLLSPARDAGDDIAAGVILNASPAAEALSQLGSGASRFVGAGRELRVVASYRAADNRLCREFRLTGAAGAEAGLACAEDGGWRIEALAARQGADATQAITPAAGAHDDPVEAALDAIGAGMVLPPAEEARAIAAGWN